MKSSIKEGVTLIFVSHNLKAVSEICPRCILLDKGKIIKDGPTNEVIRYYLNIIPKGKEEGEAEDVIISDVIIQNKDNKGPLYDAGDKIIVTIELTARVPSKKLSVSIGVADDRQYQVFNTSTERLAHTTFSLIPGEKKKITFELTLHLAPGTYHLSTYVYRYDIEKLYGGRFPAATIYMRSDSDVKGSAHLYPELVVDPRMDI
jgi:lipopolysaccharide transport system ATP-binding protein